MFGHAGKARYSVEVTRPRLKLGGSSQEPLRRRTAHRTPVALDVPVHPHPIRASLVARSSGWTSQSPYCDSDRIGVEQTPFTSTQEEDRQTQTDSPAVALARAHAEAWISQ